MPLQDMHASRSPSAPQASESVSRAFQAEQAVNQTSEDSEVQMLNKIQVRFSAGILDGLVKLE